MIIKGFAFSNVPLSCAVRIKQNSYTCMFISLFHFFQSGVFTADGLHYRIDSIDGSTDEKNTTLISKLDEKHPDYEGLRCGYLKGISISRSLFSS